MMVWVHKEDGYERAPVKANICLRRALCYGAECRGFKERR